MTICADHLAVGIVIVMKKGEKMNIGSQFDGIADMYDKDLSKLLERYGGTETEKFAEYKIALLGKLLVSKPKKILDFGCGVGRSFEYIKKYFPEAQVYGCDVSEKSLELAERYISKDRLFQNNTVESLLEKGKFDLIIMSCVMHHIDPKERQYWVEGLNAALNYGGHIAVFEHNIYNPITKSIILNANNKADNIYWMLYRKKLEELLGEHTYWSGYTLFSPIRFPGVLSIERALKWFPLGAQYCVISEKRDEN